LIHTINISLAIDKLFDRYAHDYGLKSLTVLFGTGPAFIDRIFRLYCITALKYIEFGVRSDAKPINYQLFALSPEYYSESNSRYFFHVPGSSWHGMDSTLMNYIWKNPLTMLVSIGIASRIAYYLKGTWTQRTRMRNIGSPIYG
jgi:mannosyltransferase OCH1-like enzyme